MSEIGKNVFDNVMLNLGGDEIKMSFETFGSGHLDRGVTIKRDLRPGKAEPISLTAEDELDTVRVYLTPAQACDIARALLTLSGQTDEEDTEQQEDEATRPDAPTECKEHTQGGDTTESVSVLPEEAISSLREAGDALSRVLSQVKPIRVVHRGERR